MKATQTLYRVMVDGEVIRGLLFHSRRSANETVKRLLQNYGMNAKVTTRKPEAA